MVGHDLVLERELPSQALADEEDDHAHHGDHYEDLEHLSAE